MKNKIKYVILIIVMVSGILPLFPTIVKAGLDPGPPPPPQCVDFYATDYEILFGKGTVVSGNLDSIKTNNGEYLRVRAYWIWCVYYFFDIDMKFYFPSGKYYELRFDYTDTFNVGLGASMGTKVTVYYIEGGSSTTGWLEDNGYYTIYLDVNKHVNYVIVNSYEYSSWPGDRYLNIDKLTLMKIIY